MDVNLALTDIDTAQCITITSCASTV